MLARSGGLGTLMFFADSCSKVLVSIEMPSVCLALSPSRNTAHVSAYQPQRPQLFLSITAVGQLEEGDCGHSDVAPLHG